MRFHNYIIIIIFFLWTFYVGFSTLPVPDNYDDFLPYSLSVYPGRNADGKAGGYATVSIEIIDHDHPIFISPNTLETAEDIGWSGDSIENYDRNHWKAIAKGRNTNKAAILVTTYGSGNIIYVTNPLDRYPKLLHNILVWHTEDSDIETLEIALFIDLPTELSPEQFEITFEHLKKDKHLNLNYRKIQTFELEEDCLENYNVLLMLTGWGDARFNSTWGRIDDQRIEIIHKFVRKGGLLILPEAGYKDHLRVQKFEEFYHKFNVRVISLTLIMGSFASAGIVAAFLRKETAFANRGIIVYLALFITAAIMFILSVPLEINPYWSRFFIFIALGILILTWISFIIYTSSLFAIIKRHSYGS